MSVQYALARLERIAARIEQYADAKRCAECKHAVSRHNDLSYCQVGQCKCQCGVSLASEAVFIRRVIENLRQAVSDD